MRNCLTVVLDATAIPRDRGGVGRYIEGIVQPLAPRDDLRVIVLCQRYDAALFTSIAPNAEVVVPGHWIEARPLRLLWEQLVLPRVARRLNAHVIHSPHYTFPIFTRLPRIVTVHDATFFSHPLLHNRIKRIFFRAWTRAALRKARVIVVPSRATADELGRYARHPRDVVVAHHGVDTAQFHPPSEKESEGARVIVGDAAARGWFLFLGTLEPRKNVAALVRAYREIADRRPSHGELPALVLAGSAGWGPTIDDEVAAVYAPGIVVLPGYVDRAALPGLLGNAEVVVYPSLGEGFGLPVLEAMASGALVLTTNELALPEVGGDAVAYTGTSWPEIASALEAVLASRPEKRSELRARAITRAGLFTWEASAHEHYRAYRKASP